MAGKKKVAEEVVEEVKVEGAQPQFHSEQVVFHLDKDPNDPRLKETVDGNSQPVVDINLPL